MNFNLNQLYYFFITANEMNVTRAAKILGISQPALSMQLKQFSERLGHPLFVRVGNGLRLTKAGKKVHELAKQSFAIIQRIPSTLQGQNQARSKFLQVGVAQGIERPFSVRLITLMLKTRPRRMQPEVKLISDTHASLLQQLRLEEIDVVLTDQDPEDLTVIGVCEMPVVLAAEASILTRKARTVFENLNRDSRVLKDLDLGLILPSAQFPMRSEIDAFLKKHKVRAPIVLEADRMASVVKAIADGLGAGIIPLPYVQDHVVAKRVLASPAKGFWRQPLRLLVPKPPFHHPSLPYLQEAFEDLARRML